MTEKDFEGFQIMGSVIDLTTLKDKPDTRVFTDAMEAQRTVMDSFIKAVKDNGVVDAHKDELSEIVKNYKPMSLYKNNRVIRDIQDAVQNIDDLGIKFTKFYDEERYGRYSGIALIDYASNVIINYTVVTLNFEETKEQYNERTSSVFGSVFGW